MTNEQKNYLESVKGWVDAGVIALSQLCNDVDYNQKEIELHKQHLAVCRKNVRHTLKSIVSQLDSLDEYCKSEGVEPPVWLSDLIDNFNHEANKILTK